MAGSGKQLSPAGQRIFLTVFFLICSSVGLGLWIPNFLVPVLEWSHRKKWRETPCTVVSGRSGADDHEAFEFRYRYEVDGEAYESGDPGTLGFFDSPVWTLKKGDVTVCYVNPRAPGESVLSRDFNHELWVWCAPLMFVIFPGLVLGLVLFGPKRKPEDEPGERPKLREGARVLEPERRRGCSLVAQLGCLTLFTGIGAVIILIPGFRQTWPIRVIYLVPSTLIAVGVLRFLLRSLLTLNHPRLKLTATPGQAEPGGTVELRWENQGGSNAGKGFRIVLEGREESRPRNRILSEPFATVEVVRSGPKDLRRGVATVTIPKPAMPSLSHGPHHIVWAFLVFVEVPRWPRGGEEYRYEVVARKGGAG